MKCLVKNKSNFWTLDEDKQVDLGEMKAFLKSKNIEIQENANLQVYKDKFISLLYNNPDEYDLPIVFIKNDIECFMHRYMARHSWETYNNSLEYLKENEVFVLATLYGGGDSLMDEAGEKLKAENEFRKKLQRFFRRKFILMKSKIKFNQKLNF